MADVGIQAFLEVAMDLKSNAIMREKLRKAPMQVIFTAGVHPGARTEKLPLVLHIRDAHEDALQILREYGSEHRGVVHCFQGSRSETSTGAYPARDRQPLCDTKAEEGKKYAR